MTATAFVDTNVLLYAASNAPADQPKRIIARQLLTQPEIGFSAQVLQGQPFNTASMSFEFGLSISWMRFNLTDSPY